MRTIIIGARGSALSRRQAQIIQGRLEAQCPSRRFEFKAIAAAGDRQPDVSLVAVGGEGLPAGAFAQAGIFVKELEAALLAGEIDCAVHSLKDLPLQTPGGLTIAAVTARDDARDAFISRSGRRFDEMPAGSRIGTSSPRRMSQLRYRRNDVECVEIRGNVDTRLRKLEEGRYDAIVLAACGLVRLGLTARITEWLPFEVMLPEPGQGALAIEARTPRGGAGQGDDAEVLELLRGLDHAASRTCVEAERAFLKALGGGCRVPIAAHAELQGEMLLLDGVVTAVDGLHAIRGRLNGPMAEPVILGEHLAQRLISEGAADLLKRNMRP